MAEASIFSTESDIGPLCRLCRQLSQSSRVPHQYEEKTFHQREETYEPLVRLVTVSKLNGVLAPHYGLWLMLRLLAPCE
jgi:hypothetical protein